MTDMLSLEKTPFSGLLAASEAAMIWGLEDSTIRRLIRNGSLIEGQHCRKYGKQWIITAEAMASLYGWAPWYRHLADCAETQSSMPPST